MNKVLLIEIKKSAHVATTNKLPVCVWDKGQLYKSLLELPHERCFLVLISHTADEDEDEQDSSNQQG